MSFRGARIFRQNSRPPSFAHSKSKQIAVISKSAYNVVMEQIIRNVKDIDMPDRQALEHVLGQPLHENQQVIINVVTMGVSLPVPETDRANGSEAMSAVPDWWKIYEGLSEEEIDRLDAAVNQQADLTRNFE
jgi:hypothetical protein